MNGSHLASAGGGGVTVAVSLVHGNSQVVGSPVSLLDLPNDVLLIILLAVKKLPFPSNFVALRNLSRVCSFLHSLCLHPSLYTFSVDAAGGGDFVTITDALLQTRNGDKIVVAPGIYTECLCVKKNVELVAQDRRNPPTIMCDSKYVLKLESSRCRVDGFRLVQTGSQACVYITGLYAEIENCEITSGLAACINIGRDACAILRGNRIHHSQNTGIFAYSGAFGIVEDNLIYNNKFPGISITNKANLIIRRNKIFANAQNGIHVYEQGQAVIEDNDLFHNQFPGIAIKNSFNSIIRNNRIFRNKQNGVHVFNQSTVLVAENRIFDNGFSGISVKNGGHPLIVNNIIFGNGEPGVFILQNGRGIVESNHIFENKQDGLLIKSGGNPLAKGNSIYNNGDEAIKRTEGGSGSFLCNASEGVLYISEVLRFEMRDIIDLSEKLMEVSQIQGSEGEGV